MNGPNPGYFAISVDGKEKGFSYCYKEPSNCINAEKLAVANCENRASTTCKILARGRTIVWDGEVILENWDSQPTDNHKTVRDPNIPANKSVKIVCAYAIEFSNEKPRWTENSDLIQYVKEARRRDFTLERCTEFVKRN